MMALLWRKIIRNIWLMLCLLLGNILLIGIAVTTPLFNAATMQRILQEDLRNVQYTQNTFPAIMQMRYNFNAVEQKFRYVTYKTTRDVWWREVIDEMGLPTQLSMNSYVLSGWHVLPNEPRERPARIRQVDLAGVVDFEENIVITHGRMPSGELAEGSIIEAIALHSTIQNSDLLLNELLSVRNAGDEDNPIYVKIVGLYTPKEGTEPFWSVAPSGFGTLLISDRLAEQFTENYMFEYRMVVTWVEVLDFTAKRAKDVHYYQDVIRNTTAMFNSSGNIWHFSVNFHNTIEQHIARTERLSIVLWVLQLPIYVMLALYMYMVSRQIVLSDKNSIAVLHSRGASRGQIIGLYSLQGLVIGAVSFPFGLLLGIALCQILGASNGFLEMVQRAALDVEISFIVLVYGLIAMGFSFITIILPVFAASKTTITDHKLKQTGKPKQALWQRYFLDVICFGVAVYGLYNFNIRQELMLTNLTETPAVDPLLFAGSSLFIIGAGLICLRVFPLVIKLIFLLGRGLFPPSLYASFLKIVRSAKEEQFIMLFLVFTVAIGIFSAQAARTINLNNANRIQYLAGADLVFREVWRDNTPHPLDTSPPPSVAVYTEPDFNRFIHFEEVDAISRVMRRGANLRTLDATVSTVELMGIDIRTFGETVWFREDLLSIHINYFLNHLGGKPDGVLLSDNFRTQLGFRVGDSVTITEAANFGTPGSGSFTIVGFVSHWPGFAMANRTLMDTGEMRVTDAYLAIVNLEYIQTRWGVRPYQVWMNTNGESNRFFYDFINENSLRIAEFNDTPTALTAIMSDPIVQGTNGVLTINFIMILLICFTGFLIYWILSIRSRVLQFGIFRAMGMGMRGIVGLFINEQILVTLTALLIGGIIGEITARLFVPLIKISYTAADQVIPLLIVMDSRDYFRLFGILAFMVTLCLVVLTVYVVKIKIAQTLKLGED